jgi:hypothetical protein
LRKVFIANGFLLVSSILLGWYYKLVKTVYSKKEKQAGEKKDGCLKK